MIVNGHAFFLGCNVLNLIVVMVTQLWEYTKNNWNVHFKWVNCMVCELYLHKVFLKKGERKLIAIPFKFPMCLCASITRIMQLRVNDCKPRPWEWGVLGRKGWEESGTRGVSADLLQSAAKTWLHTFNLVLLPPQTKVKDNQLKSLVKRAAVLKLDEIKIEGKCYVLTLKVSELVRTTWKEIKHAWIWWKISVSPRPRNRLALK